MNYIDISHLPKFGEKIFWKKCIGLKSKFEYNNICGEIKYINYNSSKQKINIFIKGYTDDFGIEVPTNSILNCSISRIINKSINFKYKPGDAIYNLLILEAYYKNNLRFYKYKCLNDGYIGEIRESHLLDGHCCPVCKNKKVLIGVNDMCTTNPKLASLLFNLEDGYKYTEKSSKRLDWKCPYCNRIIKKKSVCNVNNNGLVCDFCNDGISYPNKFMGNILSQFNIEYISEFSPKWIAPKRYDFYIPSLSLIIEMDGKFHYKDNCKYGKTHQESLEIDKLKDNIAKEHGLIIIRIDCNYKSLDTRFEHIKDNILLKLNKYFDFKNINFEDANLSSLQSYIITSVKLYNEGLSVLNISNQLHLCQTTIKRYLAIGTHANICHYKADNRKKPILCKSTGHAFESVQLCEKLSDFIFNVHLTNKNMSRQIRLGHPYKKLMFEYITQEEFNKIKNEFPELCFGNAFTL